jgi:hypothetical protein
MTTTETMEQIGATAEAIKSDAEHTVPVMDVGDEVRQGDIYVTRIESVPAGAVKVAKPVKQLAPGATQGSRHCLRSIKGVMVYILKNPGPLDGPIVESARPIAIDHPEHGNRIIPAGVYAVTFQRAFAEELRRVQD